jgi:hypothetical protein
VSGLGSTSLSFNSLYEIPKFLLLQRNYVISLTFNSLYEILVITSIFS